MRKQLNWAPYSRSLISEANKTNNLLMSTLVEITSQLWRHEYLLLPIREDHWCEKSAISRSASTVGSALRKSLCSVAEIFCCKQQTYICTMTFALHSRRHTTYRITLFSHSFSSPYLDLSEISHPLSPRVRPLYHLVIS